MTSLLLGKLIQDQRIVQYGITWSQFKLIQEGFANSPGVRLFFYKGRVEILSVSPEHEIFKTGARSRFSQNLRTSCQL